jgi:hypothetical protein
MRRRLHAASLAAAALAAVGVAGCTDPTAPKEVARFEGFADPSTGTLEIRAIPPDGAPQLASIVIPDDTTPGRGLGTPDSAELATEWVTYQGLNGVTTSQGAGAQPCGRAGTFCALVTVRSYFATSELHNVYIELTAIGPSLTYVGFSMTQAPTGLDNTYGLWGYPALLDSTRGNVSTGDAPGGNAASKVWYFNNPSNAAFTFRGRVMADVVSNRDAGGAVIASGFNGVCAGTPTPLGSDGNCGECGRHAPYAAACTYASNGSASQGYANLSFDLCRNTTGGTRTTPCDTVANPMVFYTCRDLTNDRGNCGVCGNACADTEACVNGACAVGYVDCGNGTHCPLGSTCSGTRCLLSSATDIGVGGDFGCATTAAPRPATPTFFAKGGHTYENNVVCWGNSHLDRLGDVIWARGVPYPDFLEPCTNNDYNATEHGLALFTDHFGLSSGGTKSAAFTHFAQQGHAVAVGFFGGNWNYVEEVETAATKLIMGAAHGVAMYPSGPTINNRVLSFADNNDHGQVGCPTWPGLPTAGYPNLVLPALNHPWNDGTYLTASDVAAGGNTTCVVLQADDNGHDGDGLGQTAGTVACWGQNDAGQASGVVGVDLTAPAVVSGVSNAKWISVGLRHSVAVTSGGHLLFWGDNSSGQFGAATAGAITDVNPGRTVDSISAGADVTCYLSSGTVYCAGRNDRGQLGLGTADSNSHPQFTAVPGLSNVAAVKVGSTSAVTAGTVCALISGGTVYCWGDNTASQLGTGSAAAYSAAPVQVEMAPL